MSLFRAPYVRLQGFLMPSPFPGMDSYLEQEVLCHDFHDKFIAAAAAHLSAQVLPRYIVLTDEDVYLHGLATDSHHSTVAD